VARGITRDVAGALALGTDSTKCTSVDISATTKLTTVKGDLQVAEDAGVTGNFQVDQTTTLTTGAITATAGVSITSGLAAGSASDDFLLDTTNVRSGGNIVDIKNQGTVLLQVKPTGILGVLSNQVAAGGASDFFFNTYNVRTNNYLMEVQNQNTRKFSVGYDGAIYAAATEVGVVTAGTGWALSGGGAADSTLLRGAGFVDFHFWIVVSNAGTASYATITTLPVGFRPQAAVTFFAQFWDQTTGKIYLGQLSISTGGVLSLGRWLDPASVTLEIAGMPAVAVSNYVHGQVTFAVV
jgi:hypothetical protein